MNSAQEERIARWLQEETDEEVIGGDADEDEGEETVPQISEHETDTEEDGDSDSETVAEDQNMTSDGEDDIPLSYFQSSACYVVKRKLRNGRIETVYRWKKQPTPPTCRTRRQNIVTHLPGPKNICSGVDTAEKAWKLLFSNEWLQKIVNYTNLKIQSQKQNYQRDRDTAETNMIEIRALIGLLYLIGLYKSSHVHVDDIFSTDGTGLDICRAVMSVQRFKFLMRHLRFDDLNTRDERKAVDKLAPIRELIEEFVQASQQCYSVGEYVTLDEMLDPFRGKCSFRQYMPNKPAKYGIKIQALVDARLFYTINLEVYVGVQPAGPYAVDNSTTAVTKRMIQPISGTGRNVTMDNWYTSVPLAEDLLTQHNLTVVGTIKKNKPEIPDDFKKKGREVSSSLFGFGKNHSTLVSYCPKKNKVVLLLSTMHDDASVNEGTPKRLPEIISFYNSTKGGVDVVDRLKLNYSVARTCYRWPLRLFFSLLDIGVVNAHVIFDGVNPSSNTSRRNFIKSLAFSLFETQLKSRSTMKNLPRELSITISRFVRSPLQEHEENEETEPKKRRCVHCPRKMDRKYFTICYKCKKNVCPRHCKSICHDCACA